MVGPPPLTGIKVLEFAGLAPGMPILMIAVSNLALEKTPSPKQSKKNGRKKWYRPNN
jgi:hypothetical protein